MNARACLVLFLASSLAGCGGEDTSTNLTTSGGDGGAAMTTSSSRSSSASTGASGGGGGSGGAPATSSSGGGGAPECVPFIQTSGTPTPGRCANGAAVTCDDEAHLVTDACDASEKCVEYPVDEYVRDPSTNFWSAGRTITWAACLPSDAEPCDFQFADGRFTPVAQDHCDLDDRVTCAARPRPPQRNDTVAGSLQGFVHNAPCDAGKKCVGAESVGQVTCIDDDTPACTGAEPLCAEDGSLVKCVGAWESPPGYQVKYGCNAGQTCRPGCAAAPAQCVGTSEVACDVHTFVDACSADGTGEVFCNGCYTIHQSCAAQNCEDDGGHQVPCRCGQTIALDARTPTSACGFSSPQVNCVPKPAADCDRSVDVDFCSGATAHRCLGYWKNTDCAATGRVCKVGGGIAGCAAPNAATCTLPDTAGGCSGDTVQKCCRSCGDVFLRSGTPQDYDCVPGYEARFDCSQESQTCSSPGGESVCSF